MSIEIRERSREDIFQNLNVYTSQCFCNEFFFVCVNCFSLDETYTSENIPLFILGSDRLLVVAPFVSLGHCDYLVLVFRHSIQK